MGTAGRLFIAVEIPGAARDRIARALNSTGAEPAVPGRLVPAANWHITLRFLGDSSDAQLRALDAALAAVVARRPVDVELAGWGAFPRPERATVVWLGARAGDGGLVTLAADAEAAAVAAGFRAERRPFHAHVTLARLRSPRDVRRALAALPAISARFTVQQVTTFRSHLGAGQPRYEPVARFPLDGC